MEPDVIPEFETLRVQFTARGEQLVSDLIGQEVNFSGSPAGVPAAEELINSFQQSAQEAINSTIANYTAGQTTAGQTTGGETTTSPALPATAQQGITTQENLIETGVGQVSANLGNDSLTNPGEGTSDPNYQFNFQPAAEGEFGGQLSLSLNGESTPLFTFDVGGTSPSTTGGNPFATQFEEFIASFASGENSLAGSPVA